MSIPERSLKNGRLGPRGLEITKDEFSRLVWDRRKPDKRPVEGEVRLVIAPMRMLHVGVLSQ
jgi:hypothetical protein